MKKNLIYILFHYLTCLLVFLIIQKPLFLLYNWSKYTSKIDFSHIGEIYEHGIGLDCVAAGYLTLFPVIVFLLSYMIPKFKVTKVLFVYDIIVSLLLSLVIVVDTVMYEFWETKLDSTILLYLNDPKNAIASVPYGFVVCRSFIVFLLAIFFFLVLRFTLRVYHQERVKGKKQYFDIITLLLVAFLVFCVVRGVKVTPHNPSQAYFSNVQYENHAALNPLFNIIFTTSKVERFEEQFNFFSEEEKGEIFSGLFPTNGKTKEMVLKERRPNILLIVLEGYGDYLIQNRKVSPNLYRLSREGFSFTQCHCSSFRTDRGIVSLLSGYLGQPTTSIMHYPRKSKTLPGIPKEMKRLGYETQMVYGGDMNFFNMRDYFIAVGHDRLIDENCFDSRYRTQRWGVPDQISFNWLYADILKKYHHKETWYTTFLTLSSHEPFDVPYHRLKDCQMNAYAYTDEVLGRFIMELRKTPAWNDLLIIVTADHGNRLIPRTSPKFSFIPFFMTGGAVKNCRRINRIVSQTDIAATLLGQLGQDHRSFRFSRDVLADTYTYSFAFNTYDNGFIFYDNSGCTVYDNNAGKCIYGQDERREKKGKAILQTLYDDLGSR